MTTPNFTRQDVYKWLYVTRYMANLREVCSEEASRNASINAVKDTEEVYQRMLKHGGDFSHLFYRPKESIDNVEI
jgi:hypothetical protein